MATQLKRNALHFSDALAKDQAVVVEAEQKLEGNYGLMERERDRLRDHGGKSRGTTCLVVMIMLVVVLLFALMVVLIRFSRK
jgi:SNARE protein 1